MKIERAAAQLEAIGNPTRLKVYRALVRAGDDGMPVGRLQERLGIAVHCVGAMGRLLEEAVDWATTREQGGARIIDHQGVSFPLADSAADAAAARLLAYEVAALVDSGADPKVVHAKASLAKLFASDAAREAMTAFLERSKKT